MLALRTFGGLTMEADGAPWTGAAVQRKPLALLAFVAAAGKQGLSRDKLVAYLWPEVDAAHARHLLKQTCYALRREPHAPGLLGGSAQLRLNAAAIASDVAMFEDALERRDPAGAVALYRGPFLDGFYVDGAGEFERWVESERERLATRAGEALEALATKAASAGDLRGCVSWWRRLGELDPLSSRAALGLMQALAAAGERPEALRHGLAHGALVRQELAAEPAGALTALIEQLRNASGDGEVRGAEPVATHPLLGAVAPSWAPRPRKLRRATVAGLAIVAVVGLFAAGLMARRRDGASPSGRTMIVVLPFENLGSPDDEYFADGLTEAVTTRLTAIRSLGVIARPSAMQYKRTRRTPREIGKELGVAYVLSGTVRWERPPAQPGRLRVVSTLTRASDETQLWAEVYDTLLAGVFAVQSVLGEHVAQALDITLVEPEREALVARPTDNLPAYEAYMRGWEARARGFDPADLKHAAEMFERAATLDPAFAPAYAELAIVDLLLYNNYIDRTEARLAEARAALSRALRLNPNLPEARFALGEYYSWNLRDWVHALEEFQRIRRFRPNYTRVFDPLADVARRQGKWKESLAAYRMALELNPRSATVPASMGDVYIALRRYPEAIAAYDRALEIAPHSVDLRFTKALAYLSQTGDLPGVRRLLPEVSENMAPTGVEVLVATLADVVSLLDDAQRAKLLEATPGALDGDTAGLALAKAMAYRLGGAEGVARTYFDSARVALEANLARREDDYGRLRCMLGIALAGLGRADEAMREGKRAVETLPVSKDALEGPLMLANLARIYVMLGERDKAVDQLETVLARPGPLSAGGVPADPFWDPLRGSPRVPRLAAARD